MWDAIMLVAVVVAFFALAITYSRIDSCEAEVVGDRSDAESQGQRRHYPGAATPQISSLLVAKPIR